MGVTNRNTERRKQVQQYPAIKLMKGATTAVEVDLTDFDMQGGYVLMVVREACGCVVREWRFDERGTHVALFDDELTASMEVGGSYEYDLMWHVDGERFAQCAPSPVEVSRTVGGYPHGADD